MPTLTAVQFRPRLAQGPADVRDNFRRLEPLLAKAASLGSDLVVLPELCLTGCTIMSPEEAALVSEPLDGWTFRAFRDFAVRAECYVAFGLVEDSGEALHNTAAVVGPDGELVLASRKANGAGCDYLWAVLPEEPMPVAETDIGTLSAVVCRDLRNEMPDGKTDILGGKKVDVVAGLTNWGKGFWPSSTWMEFVYDRKCSLVVANRWGTEEREGPYGRAVSEFGQGGSAIIEGDGRVRIGGLRLGEDCVVSHRVEEK